MARRPSPPFSDRATNKRTRAKRRRRGSPSTTLAKLSTRTGVRKMNEIRTIVVNWSRNIRGCIPNARLPLGVPKFWKPILLANLRKLSGFARTRFDKAKACLTLAVVEMIATFNDEMRKLQLQKALDPCLTANDVNRAIEMLDPAEGPKEEQNDDDASMRDLPDGISSPNENNRGCESGIKTVEETSRDHPQGISAIEMATSSRPLR
jgi:hypothetical protein